MFHSCLVRSHDFVTTGLYYLDVPITTNSTFDARVLFEGRYKAWQWEKLTFFAIEPVLPLIGLSGPVLGGGARCNCRRVTRHFYEP